ncbi:hypothetical protein HMPREF9372_0820 [Sporosarcina newyorkensis 2681]|uniref:Uncharacterized protein n=1 Tax=Sporosarcina newyorkensis 2681 TaxID=1027292 RepID=F9DPU0_9BACL|nr:hypothetical protein HMPREF9372_0820 [Sporosarcina newyorkensis 2681]
MTRKYEYDDSIRLNIFYFIFEKFKDILNEIYLSLFSRRLLPLKLMR